MELKDLLKQLRKEESPNEAADRIGISRNYYRDLERGYNIQRGKPMNPSLEILRKIAKGFKVDVALLAAAAGIPYESKIIPFEDYPELHQWYTALPSENIEEVKQLYKLWVALKGDQQNAL